MIQLMRLPAITKQLSIIVNGNVHEEFNAVSAIRDLVYGENLKCELLYISLQSRPNKYSLTISDVETLLKVYTCKIYFETSTFYFVSTKMVGILFLSKDFHTIIHPNL